MHILTGLAIGMVIGFVEGILLYVIPEEPLHRRVLFPAMLKGVLVGIIVGLLVRPGSAFSGLFVGTVCGILFNRLSLLREGGATPKEAAYVLPISIAGGALIGALTALI